MYNILSMRLYYYKRYFTDPRIREVVRLINSAALRFSKLHLFTIHPHLLRTWDNSTYRYYFTALVISEFH